MREIDVNEAMKLANENLPHGGIFLSSKADGTRNTMTIGWATSGWCWKYPVFVSLVREQRFTYHLIEKSGVFTVSVPTKNELKKELAFAGTQSGRDVDKFSGHGITAVPAIAVDAPIIKECGLHFECRVRLTQPMTADKMDDSIIKYTYQAGDFHIMFWGEIVKCYTTDE